MFLKLNRIVSHIMSINDKTDKDGVLDLIQNLEYNYSLMHFKVTYFTGWIRVFPAEQFCDIELLDGNPSLMQWLEAYRSIEEYSLKHWKEWYFEKFDMRWLNENILEKNSVLVHQPRLHLCSSRRH